LKRKETISVKIPDQIRIRGVLIEEKISFYCLFHQEAVRGEVGGVCGGGAATLQDMAALPLVRGLLREVTRLYPVAPFLTRVLG